MTQAEYMTAVAQYTSEGTDLASERAVFLTELPYVRLVCAAWPNCPKSLHPERVSVEDQSDWLALWRAVEFNQKTLMRMSGVPSHEFDDALFIAKSNRLIHPDGGLSRWVRLNLYAQAVGTMPKQGKGRKRNGRQGQGTGQ